MQGILLILYILIVSGLIAVVGDRVGYRIGKKRLSWFNLRPRHTAILVAVLTGVTISGVTLGTLLLLNRSLADALFNYSRTLSYYRLYIGAVNQQLETLQADLQEIQSQLAEAEARLNEAKIQRGDAQERLGQLLEQQEELLAQRDQIQAKLEAANTELAKTQDQLDAEQAQLEAEQARLAQIQVRLQTIQAEAEAAQAQVSDLETQTEQLEAAKTALQLDRDQLERSLGTAQTALTRLETQRDQLESDIDDLTQVARRLRSGELSILSGEVLAIGVISTPDLDQDNPEEQLQAQLDQILAEAEQQARLLGAQPLASMTTAVQIRRDDVSEIVSKVSEPGDWVVRIFSISNRLRGEAVPVGADVHPNKQIFDSGTVLASTVIQPGQEEETLQRQLLQLLSRANFRSQEAGLLSNPITGTVGEFSQVRLLEAVQALQRIQKPTDVKVITETEIYTAGPLQVSFEMEPGSQYTTGQMPASP